MFRLCPRAWPIALIALAIAFTGCQPKTPDAEVRAATSTPDAAVVAAVTALEDGDLKAFVESQLPPAEIARLRAEWDAKRATDPTDPDAAKRFDETMALLTRPDAEAALLAKLEPQLQRFEREFAPQLGLYVGMVQGLALGAIQQSKTLSDVEKGAAAQSVTALGEWASTAAFTDRDNLKVAIGHLVTAAREVRLGDFDALRALEFDEALAKASIAWRSLKETLAVYGFSIDETLQSVTTEVLSRDGDTATVKVNFVILGQPRSVETRLMLVDGRWYNADTIERLEREAAARQTAPAA